MEKSYLSITSYFYSVWIPHIEPNQVDSYLDLGEGGTLGSLTLRFMAAREGGSRVSLDPQNDRLMNFLMKSLANSQYTSAENLQILCGISASFLQNS